MLITYVLLLFGILGINGNSSNDKADEILNGIISKVIERGNHSITVKPFYFNFVLVSFWLKKKKKPHLLLCSKRNSGHKVRGKIELRDVKLYGIVGAHRPWKVTHHANKMIIPVEFPELEVYTNERTKINRHKLRVFLSASCRLYYKNANRPSKIREIIFHSI